MDRLIWTTERPTETGAFWVKNSNIPKMSAGIVWVISVEDYDFEDNHAGSHLEVLYNGESATIDIDEVEAQFAGPIEAPIESAISNGTRMMPRKIFDMMSPAVKAQFVLNAHGRVID